MNLQQSDLMPDKVFLVPLAASHQSKVQQIEVQRSRQRGVVLTEQGWKKLLMVNVLQNQRGGRHTYDLLGGCTLMSPRTVSKIMGREVGVDRRSLQQFFDTFNLLLESDDYRLAGYHAKPSTSYSAIAFVFQLPS